MYKALMYLRQGITPLVRKGISDTTGVSAHTTYALGNAIPTKREKCKGHDATLIIVEGRQGCIKGTKIINKTLFEN